MFLKDKYINTQFFLFYLIIYLLLFTLIVSNKLGYGQVHIYYFNGYSTSFYNTTFVQSSYICHIYIVYMLKLNIRRWHVCILLKYMEFKLLVHMHKALHDRSPVYLRDMLQMYTPGRTLRSQNTRLLVVPKIRTTAYGNRCFSYAAPISQNLRQRRLSKNF